MVADIEATAVEIEAQLAHDGHGQSPLVLDGKWPLERLGFALLGENLLERDGQEPFEILKDRFDIRDPKLGLVHLEQRIVARQTHGIGQRIRLLTGEPNEILEQWQDRLPVVSGPGFAPGLFALQPRQLARMHELSRHGRGLEVFPLQIYKIG